MNKIDMILISQILSSLQLKWLEIHRKELQFKKLHQYKYLALQEFLISKTSR